jgi:hypothetical protein
MTAIMATQDCHDGALPGGPTEAASSACRRSCGSAAMPLAHPAARGRPPKL